MIENNEIKKTVRLKEIFLDLATIFVYLFIVTLTSFVMYFIFTGGIIKFSEIVVHLAFPIVSVIPIITMFSIIDYEKGSVGKIENGLIVYFKEKSLIKSLIRNVIKFLPLQLFIFVSIRRLYRKFDRTCILIMYIALIYIFIMLLMSLFRKDKRHLGDIIAGTQVQMKNN